MTVLITRPILDALNTSEYLQKFGIVTMVEPMMRIEIYPIDESMDIESFDALVFTSKNAVRYLSQYQNLALSKVRCFAVGSVTAEALNNLGVKFSYHANNNLEELLNLISLEIGKKSKVLYLRGKYVSHDLCELLQGRGFLCDEKICYEAVPVESFSDKLLIALAKNQINNVLLYSNRTAEVFFKLCSDYQVAKCLKRARILTVDSGLYKKLCESWSGEVVFLDEGEVSIPGIVK